MRVIVAFMAALAMFTALGGCFHHQQAISQPEVLPPLK
jgi:hypothetical protein